MPKVDVIVLTHNRPGFLTKAIESILNQTFQDFAIIVVDDGSEDETARAVESFRNERIKYIRNETKMGEGRSRNVGLANANAEYIAFLDDDDEWLPEKLELQVALLESQPAKVGGVYTGFTAINHPGGEILYHRIPRKRGDIYLGMIHENVVGTSSTVLLRRECFERVGQFDESIPYGLDYDMWIRISKDFHFDCIEKPLVKYHYHEGQLTNEIHKLIAGQEAMLKKYRHFFAQDKKSYSLRLADLALLYRESGDIRKGLKAQIEAIKAYPLRKKEYFSLIKILGLSIVGRRGFDRLKGGKKRKRDFSSYGNPWG